MPNAVNISGERYGRLVAIAPTTRRTKNGGIIWSFRCDCGQVKELPANSVRTRLVKSCGCLAKPHGETGTKLHNIWCDMRERCENSKSDTKGLYCNRGITVCEEWHDYLNFRSWALSNGYNDGLTIDRIDNDKGYCPDNCRWSTPREQANNKRNNRIISINGTEKPISEWCREYGISVVSVYRRVRNYHMSFVEAITIPPVKRRNPHILRWIDGQKKENELDDRKS